MKFRSKINLSKLILKSIHENEKKKMFLFNIVFVNVQFFTYVFTYESINHSKIRNKFL